MKWQRLKLLFIVPEDIYITYLYIIIDNFYVITSMGKESISNANKTRSRTTTNFVLCKTWQTYITWDYCAKFIRMCFWRIRNIRQYWSRGWVDGILRLGTASLRLPLVFWASLLWSSLRPRLCAYPNPGINFILGNIVYLQMFWGRKNLEDQTQGQVKKHTREVPWSSLWRKQETGFFLIIRSSLYQLDRRL